MVAGGQILPGRVSLPTHEEAERSALRVERSALGYRASDLVVGGTEMVVQPMLGVNGRVMGGLIVVPLWVVVMPPWGIDVVSHPMVNVLGHVVDFLAGGLTCRQRAKSDRQHQEKIF